uniref:Transmembrane and coiled-coil domain family 3 n=2 Tax=Iconisemion striatum TaxID=60296 RepID=A0A1A7Z636_9TELE
MLDKSEVVTLGLPSTTSHGGSDSNISSDGAGTSSAGVTGAEGSGTGEPQRTRAALEHLQQKILKVTEQIRVEQEARDDNVAEYLKLAHNADKQQASRIKQVFEKKNQKSAQTIAHLHKKLEHYHKKLKEIEQNGPARQPKDVLRDMQQGLKDVGANVRAGISGFGGGVVEGVKGGVSALTHTAVVSKPREFASLIRNKFGSADNIAHLKTNLDSSCPSLPPESAGKGLSSSTSLVGKPKYPSDDECSSGSTSFSADSNGNTALGGSSGGQLQQAGGDVHGKLDLYYDDVREIKDTQSQLEEDIEEIRTQFKKHYDLMSQTLQEEKYRYGRLEDQLNDLSELHQHEMTNLKQELASIEERVAYQAQERARDIQEALESCQTRVSKLELHQQHQQQTVQLESPNARVLLGKSINIMLAVITVILVCVSTAAKFVAPLMRSRYHVVATLVGVCFLTVFWKNWDRLQFALDQMLVPT